MSSCFAYLHCRPTGVPFYVGKGTKGRAEHIGGQRNSHYINTVNYHGEDNILVGKIECSSEEIALELEKGLIKCLKRMNIGLTNKTDGGEGVSGLAHTDQTKQKMSESHKGMKYSDSHCQAIREALLKKGHKPSQAAIDKGNDARRGKPLSDEHRAKLSALRSGEGNPRFGKMLDEETKAKIAKSLTGKKLSVATKAKMQAAHQTRKAVREGRLFSLVQVKE